MIYFWLLQLAALCYLIIAPYLNIAVADSSTLILSLMMLIVIPLFVPLVETIRADITPMRPLYTRAGLIGLIVIGLIGFSGFALFHISLSTVIFICIALFSVFFAVEGRIFFLLALLGLIFTVGSLLVDIPALAEGSSILVYLSLVLGVVAEIGAPFFSRWYQGSPAMIRVSREFITGYHHALSDYAQMIVIGLQFLFVIALIGRGSVWSFDYQMLLYIAVGIWGFSIMYLLTGDRVYHLRDFAGAVIDRIVYHMASLLALVSKKSTNE